MSNETYNGWTNYETWRVNLEMIDGLGLDYFNGREEEELSQELYDYVAEFLANGSEGFALSLALSFISKVDWNEIASHLLEDYKEEENEAA